MCAGAFGRQTLNEFCLFVQREALKLCWDEAEEEPGTIVIGDWVCSIQDAPEPDAVQWGHLAYSARNCRLRR
jgi:hypothetical protein